ncbi:MAG: rRNA maturation RNase YbeY [Arenicella sp.]
MNKLKKVTTNNSEAMLAVDVQNGCVDCNVDEFDIVAWAECAYRSVANQEKECVIRMVDESEGHALNQQFRNKDYATNVLSFTYDSPVADSDEVPYLGDIVICYPVIQRESEEQEKTLSSHLTHMVVHGILHLCGYDHEENEEAEKMEQLEIEILAKLNILNPYS